MSQSFLGRGWKLNLSLNSQKQFEITDYEEDVKEAIYIILSTKKGERIMRPNFGCGIHDYAFSVINVSNLALMKESIKDAISTWEPRIELKDIEIATDNVSDGLLSINVFYVIKSTNSIANLVYPYYINEGE